MICQYVHHSLTNSHPDFVKDVEIVNAAIHLLVKTVVLLHSMYMSALYTVTVGLAFHVLEASSTWKARSF